jgi:hypothetical protein
VSARAPSTSLRALGLSLSAFCFHGCGFIGFEADREDAGQPDAAAAGWPDGGSGEMDASPSEPLPDASSVDARVPSGDDAGLDAAPGNSDAALDASVVPGPATQVTDYCASIPALPAAPVLDGVVDAQLNVVTLTPEGWVSNAGAADPVNTHASFAVAWRPNGLYVYLRVVDSNRLPPLAASPIWEGDGVELYFDSDGVYAAAPAYDNPGTIQIIVAAPEDGSTPSQRSTRFRNAVDQGSWTSSDFTALPTADGYVLEGLLQADTLELASLSLAPGAQVGLDLGVNVSVQELEPDAGARPDGHRLGQYFLHVGPTASDGCNGRPYCTPNAFCRPTLIE